MIAFCFSQINTIAPILVLRMLWTWIKWNSNSAINFDVFSYSNKCVVALMDDDPWTYTLVLCFRKILHWKLYGSLLLYDLALNNENNSIHLSLFFHLDFTLVAALRWSLCYSSLFQKHFFIPNRYWPETSFNFVVI